MGFHIYLFLSYRFSSEYHRFHVRLGGFSAVFRFRTQLGDFLAPFNDTFKICR